MCNLAHRIVLLETFLKKGCFQLRRSQLQVWQQGLQLQCQVFHSERFASMMADHQYCDAQRFCFQALVVGGFAGQHRITPASCYQRKHTPAAATNDSYFRYAVVGSVCVPGTNRRDRDFYLLHDGVNGERCRESAMSPQSKRFVARNAWREWLKGFDQFQAEDGS